MALALDGKAISDPLYGNIRLTGVESSIVSSPAFQRLHNIRQLGLGHLVFPSAGYSRFAHSIGACQNADRIITAIEENSTRTFSDTERQCVRIAALIHDLGHFPFSHTTEHASKSYIRGGMFRKKDAQTEFPEIAEKRPDPTFIDHEDTGKLIFESDVAINSALKLHSINQDDIKEVFLDPVLATIISSDLDCDRLDYLRRTAHHSGAPYGAVDVDFIISKSTIDDDNQFCFESKARRAADHLLVSRFYDFMQIPFQKTVASLEWSLEEAVISMMRNGNIDISRQGVERYLVDNQWALFDDAHVIEIFRRYSGPRKSTDLTELQKDHIRAVVYRTPAKMVYDWDCLLPYSSNDQETKEELLNLKIDQLCGEESLDRKRFKIWKAPFKLSKAGPLLQRSKIVGETHSDEEEQQLIKILDANGSSAMPLIDCPNTVSHHLAQLQYRTLRVYYLPENNAGNFDFSGIEAALADQ